MTILNPCPFCCEFPKQGSHYVDIGGAISRKIYYIKCNNSECLVQPGTYVEGECGYDHLDTRTNEEAKLLARKIGIQEMIKKLLISLLLGGIPLYGSKYEARQYELERRKQRVIERRMWVGQQRLMRLEYRKQWYGRRYY